MKKITKGIVLTQMDKNEEAPFGATIALRYVDSTNQVQGTRFGAITAEGFYEAMVGAYTHALSVLTAVQADEDADASAHAKALADFTDAFNALVVPGSILKKEVEPYEIDNDTRTTRIVVKFEDESWDDAILLAGSRPLGSADVVLTPESAAQALASTAKATESSAVVSDEPPVEDPSL